MSRGRHIPLRRAHLHGDLLADAEERDRHFAELERGKVDPNERDREERRRAHYEDAISIGLAPGWRR